MGFSIIVAVDKNRGMGINNDLPWKLKADMKWFKEATLSGDSAKQNAVIMGRKTWDSIPEKFRPLPGRINIVITRYPDKCQAPYCATNLDHALELAKQLGNVSFVIGGGSIYELACKHKDLKKLYITEIDKDFHCDTFFPDYSQMKMIKLISQGEEGDLTYQIREFQPQL